MSKITIIYDKLREVIPTLVTGRTELPNPYSLLNNPNLYLNNGWGLTVGEGVEAEIDTLCHDFETRAFTISLVNHLATLNNTHDLMANASKLLLEDIRLLKNKFIDFDQLEIHESIEKISFESSSGIEFLINNEVSYLIASITIAIDYSEII